MIVPSAGATSPVATAASRNRPCECGSGRRFKHCCGAASVLPAASTHNELIELASWRERGLAFQRDEAPLSALALYERVLAVAADDWDVQHMRATALYQAGLIEQAVTAFVSLLRTPAMQLPGFMTNFGLAVAARGTAWREPPSLRGSRQVAQATPRATSIAVVMPVYNHAAFVAEAMHSVFAQTRPPDEFIIIDDGSSDDSAAVVRETLRVANCPVRFIARENRGAHATLNEAIELAGSAWIQALNSDDALTPDRLLQFEQRVATCAQWGYARVQCVNTHGHAIDSRTHAKAAEIYRVQDGFAAWPSHGLALLTGNASVSTGNLFFAKSLWRALGGFAPLRYNHDWDFCLRASLHAEPVVLSNVAYCYRLHGHNTINESRDAARAEVRRMMHAFVRDAESGQSFTNERAPCSAVWGEAWVELLAAIDLLSALPLARLEALVLRPRAGVVATDVIAGLSPPEPAAGPTAPAPLRQEATAC